MSGTNERRRRNVRGKMAATKLLCGASLAAVAFVLPSAARAQGVDRYWDANGPAQGSGGTGNWDTSSALWSEANSDVLGPYRAWVNDAINPDNAIFGATGTGVPNTAGTITLTQPITVHNLTFQSVNGWTLSGGTLTLAGATPTINILTTTVINSVLAGTAGLTKLGASTLTLNGVNTFSGGITLGGGGLAVANDAALGALSNNLVTTANASFGLSSGSTSRSVTIGGGTTLTISNAGAGTARLTGSGSVNLSPNARLTNDLNDYTGTTRFNGVNGGSAASYFSSVRNLGEASALGAPTTVQDGTITFAGGSQYSDSIVYTGTGDTSNRNWVLSGSTARVFRQQGSGKLTLTGDISMTTTGFYADRADFELLGVLSGTGGATFSGSAAGGIRLGGANTFAGTASIVGGIVRAPVLADAGVASALGAGSAVALGNLAQLSYTGAGDSSNRTWTSSGTTAILADGSGALTLSGGFTFANGTLTLGGSFAGTNSFAGVISGTGNLVGSGNGVWILDGANTRTGTITLNGGALRAGNAAAFGTTTGVTINAGTLDLNGFDLTAPTLNGTGGTLALGSATLTLNTTLATNSFAGNITGTGGLTKLGTGTLTLSGASSYTGATNIQGGTLALKFATASASNVIGATSTLNMSGGVLAITGAAGGANSQTFNGLNITAGANTITGVAGTGGALTVNFGAITRTGGIVNFNLPTSGNFTTTNTSLGGWATVNGTDYAKVVGGNILAFTDSDYVGKDNAATWQAGEFITDRDGNATSFFGTVAGSIQLGGLQFTTAAPATITIAGNQTLGVDGALIIAPSVGGNNQRITGGNVTGLSGAGGVLGVLHNGTGTLTIDSTIIDNGGSTGFTKGGTGTVSLTGLNSFTGGTTLSNGRLVVNSIANGGTASALGASGAASANLVLEGGVLQYSGTTATTDRGFTLVNGGSDIPTIQVDGTANLTFTGQITSPDDEGLLKAGSGTLSLDNATNNYIGVTTVSAGTLSTNALADGGFASGIGASSNASANLVIQNGARFQYTGATTAIDRGFTVGAGGGRVAVAAAATELTVGGGVVGTGGLTKDGDGTLILSGTNSYTGGTRVSAGTLRAGSTSAFGATTNLMTIDPGATLDLAGLNNQVGALAGTGRVLLSGAILTTGGANGTFSGTMSGAGGFTRAAGGTQTITGCTNDYTGVTTVAASGGLIVDCLSNGGVASGIGASGNAASNLVFAGGTFRYDGATVVTDRGFTLQATSNVNVYNAATTLTFTGTVTGAGVLQKQGDGTLVLSGNNNYSGGTLVSAGTLRAGSATALGSGGGFSLSSAAGAVLDLNGFNFTVTALAGGGTAGGEVRLGGATLTITNGGAYNGLITGAGNIVKAGGGGTETFGGCANSYSGSTTITSGALVVQCLSNGGTNSSIGASSNAASNLILTNATLTYNGSGDSTDRLLTAGGTITQIFSSGTGALNFANTGAIVFTAGTTTPTTISLGGTNTDDNKFALRINDNGTYRTALTKRDAGTWILTNAANTYTGVTNISAGVLGVDTLANGGVASSIGASSNAAANLILGTNSTLRYTGVGSSTDRLFTLGVGTTAIESVGSGAIAFTNTGAITYSGNGQRVVSLGGTNMGANIMGGAIGNQGTYVTSLAKNGTGTWILTGNNTFSGSTIINDGNLVIGNGGTTGNAGTGNVVVDHVTSTLSFNRSDTFSFTGTISGPGSIAQIGGGTTVLTAINSIGAASVNRGMLQVNGGLQTATLAMNGDGALSVNGTVEGASAGAYTTITGDSGASTIAVSAGGTLRATGDLGAGADSVIVAGLIDTGSGTLSLGAGNDILQLNDGAAIAGTIDGGAGSDTIVINNAAAFLLDGAQVTGFEALDKQNVGVLTLTGAHSYSAGTTVEAGTLQIGTGGTTGSITGDILNNATLSFKRADAYTYAGAVTGTGLLSQTGGGVLTLTGVSSYTGNTLVSSGTLQLQAGGQITATTTLSVAGGGNVIVDGTGSKLVATGSTTGTTSVIGTTNTGASTLTVRNGGSASFGSLGIGEISGANGILTVTGAGSRVTTSGDVSMGKLGTATVNVLAGGTMVSSGNTTLIGGQLATNSIANVTVSGAGSEWAITNSLNARRGTITVANGGRIVAGSAVIGFSNGIGINNPAMSVTVTGANSRFETIGALAITNGAGTGSLTIADGGVVSVGGRTLAMGTGTATLNIGGAGLAAPAAAAGTLDADAITTNAASTINFNHTNTGLVFAAGIAGAGQINQLAGVTNLTGNSAGFTGVTNVRGGTLRVNGTLGGVTSVTSVSGGATLGGSGTIGGNVNIADGILAPGNSPGALTINGNLSLAAASQLAFEFGRANAPGHPLNDVVNVGGNLTLDGTLNVSVPTGGNFDIGLYRVLNYAGGLTNNGLLIGTLPVGVDRANLFVQTAIGGQVNLVNTGGATLNFWDGAAGPKFNNAVNGGSGIWQSSAGNNNWTDATGAVNAGFSDGAIAIFSAAPGTVTVDNGSGAVRVGGIQFASDGYVIAGDTVTLTSPQTVIRVGDGSAAGAGYTATIDAALAGAGVQLVKSDAGTLRLTGTNSYSGGTLVAGGTLGIAGDASLGDVAGGLTLDGGMLETATNITTNRVVTLAGNGTFLTDGASVLTLAGPMSGAGALFKTGTGTLILTGSDVHGGGTTINAGTLQVGDGGTAGSIAGSIANNAALVFNRADNVQIDGLISGAGTVTQQGGGVLTFTASNTNSGLTTIAAGTLRLGNAGATGSVGGDIANNGRLIFDRSNQLDFAGLISGTGTVEQFGSGTTVLTGANNYAGPTLVNGGTLLINGDQRGATGLATVSAGATLGGSGVIGGNVIVADGATLAPGDASGPGTLTINGSLSLGNAAHLAYDFGQSNVVGGPLNDLTRVVGDLTLGGTIDVTVSPGGSFDIGVYRVISYGGTLTDNGLVVGVAPAGAIPGVQTSVAGQVNLVNSAGATLAFWDGGAPGNRFDGQVNGGDGLWQSNGGNANWADTSGHFNGPFNDGSFAIFSAAPGVVQVDNSLGAVAAAGMQFASDGYVITGQDLALVGPQSIIRVGDGTADGRGYTATVAAALTGNTQLVKTDLGTLVLSGVNSYTGGTRINSGTLSISSDANLGEAAGALSFDGGTLHSTASITSGRNIDMIGGGTIVTDAGTSLIFIGTVTGSGDLVKDGAGVLALNDTSSHTGTTRVRAGSLFVNGDLSAATGLVHVAAGAMLGGSGIIGGDVLIAAGATLAPGNSPGTLTINGGLTLNAGSVLNFEFGQANVAGGALNDLVNVGGDLTLDGTLNVAVSAGGSFGPGVYRVFNYGGALTNNGLTLGATPGGSVLAVQTAIVGQVNLVNTAGLTLSFWDGNAGPKNNGLVDGGDGVWRLGGGSDNWTDMGGGVNADYMQNSFAIFAGAPGVVTIDNSGGGVHATGLQFASDGYTITGDALTLTGAQAIIQVGDGSAASAGYTATIDAPLTGLAGLVKTDAGTLVLAGTNSYIGGTAVNGGTLRIAADANLGDVAGGLSFDGGTLNTTATFASSRAVNLPGAGIFLTDAGTTLTLDGLVSGAGALTKSGAGLLIVTADNTYAGATNIVAGALQLGSGGTSGSLTGNVVNNSALIFDRADNFALAGVISGTGTVDQAGAGTTILAADNIYTGGTTIGAGRLQLGNGGTTGGIVGDVVDNGVLAFNRVNQIIFAGAVSGSGGLDQIGTGTTILTGANSYTGATNVIGGTLLINGDQSAATGLTSVGLGATLGGSGIIGGNVALANGATLMPGASGAGVLTINGNLSLAAGSSMNFDFGAPNAVGDPVNDLVNVAGDLSLGGTINVAVTPGGAFGIGLYRIINYAGALTDNGLAIGTMPVGADVFVQTAVAGQVNLINTGGALLNFWDGDAAGNAFNGAIDGGNGSWLASTGTAWADATGAVNASYANGAFAIFTGASGVVTIDNSRGAVTASGMQFASDGYVIAGDTLTLTGPQAVIRVGDGSAAGGGYTATIDAAIAGAAQLVKTDAGTLVLGGTNSYIGGTAINGGTLQIASDANLGAATGGLSFNGGTLATTADISSARTIDLAGPALFSTGAGTVLTLTGAIGGAGNLGKADSGTLILAGTGSFTGGTTVTQGTLLVNGNYAAATGLTDVDAAATLGGTGTIGGNVRVSGTLAPGAGGAGTLTIGGNLTLVSTATLAYDFGQANVAGGALNDLVNVGGNLVLDGTVNVSVPTGGSFGAGVYRLFNYGGTLTDNGLTLGNLPAGSNVAVQTSIAGQVNLINFAGLSLNFWDGVAGPKNNGAINGGSGVWQNSTGNDNWTDANGLVNAAYSDASFAVFGGTAGTVTVDNSLGAVSAAGMQFATSGYVIAGDAITLTGPQAVIRVGDGSAAGAGFVATINAALSGSAQLVKTDAGTLVLAGTNSYTGGTAINGGTLQIAGDASLGAASGGLSFDGGTLATSATLTSNRAVTVVGTGTIATANATTFTLAGALSGTGALTKAGGGTLLLTGDSSGYAGATHVAAGTLAVTGALGGTMTVGSGARLEGTGSVGAVTNFGVVAPGRDSFGTLTMASYAGAGGRLEIRTALGGDASPADRLVTGTTAGTTTIDVINRGGLGAQTVEGVKIVDVTGASNGTFLLHGDYVFGGEQAVIAGAYGYRLYKGGVSTPTDGDWYLRSSLLVTPEQPQVPLYQPGVPVYEAYGQTLLALTDVGTMQQRTGNRQWAATESGKPSGIWGRMQAGRSRPNATVSTSLADVNVDSWKMEIGADHVLSERGDGASLVLGVLGSYGEANANVASLYGNGAIKTKGYGAGATLTWFGPAGFYVDSRAQLTWFDSRLRSAVLGTLADGNHGFGQAYSLEVGKRAPVGGKLSVTPQIQMVYQHVGFDRFTDPNDATVSSGRGGSLKSRWGLSVDRQDARSYVYGVANLSYEWLDGMVTDVSGTPIRRENHRLWGELGVGGSALIGNRVTLFTEASANTAINDFGKSYNLKGTAGLRLAF